MQSQTTQVSNEVISHNLSVDFKQTFEHSAIGTAIVSLEGKWLEVNNAICKIVGYKREELLEIDFQTITHPDDLDKDIELLTKLLNNEINSYQMEKRYFHKNGKVIWVQLNVSVSYSDSGEPKYFISQVQDISERKLTEKRLSKSLDEQGHLNRELKKSYEDIEDKVIERTQNLQKVINALKEEIQEHKKTREDLYETERKYEDLYDNAPDMYVSIDAETATVLECNQTLLNATGYNKDEMIGMKIFDLYAPDCQIDVKEAFNQSFTEGQVNNKELILKRKDGSKFYVSLNVSSLRNINGKIILSRSSLRDISQQKELENQLQRTIEDLSKKRSFEKIIQNVSQSIHNSIDMQVVLDNTVESLAQNISTISSASIYLIEGDKAILKAQKGLPKWFMERAGKIPKPKGFTWKTMLENKIVYCQDVDQDKTIGPAGRKMGSKSYIALPINVDGNIFGALNLHSLNKNAFNDEIITLLKTLVRQIEVAFSNANKANELTISQHKLKDINNSLEKRVKNRTKKLKEYTEELESSNKELEQFAYAASHDLQEPLRKIKSFTELLASKYKGNMDEKADQYIEYIVDGASRMQNLISDLLSYSRVGKENTSISEVDLNQTLEKVIDALSLKISETNTEIIIGKLPRIYSNDNDMFRVLLNLINNGIKFRREVTNCVIKINSEENENEYTISVADNGIGIKEQYIQRIFGIFERLHSRSEYPGTGIGLAICRKIVEKNGGRIWADSKKDEGTKFSFTVPKENSNVHKAD